MTSCRRDGTCCLSQCGCDAVYNRAFLAKLETHQEDCSMGGCPKAKCSRMRAYAASCEAGLCVSTDLEGAAVQPTTCEQAGGACFALDSPPPPTWAPHKGHCPADRACFAEAKAD